MRLPRKAAAASYVIRPLAPQMRNDSNRATEGARLKLEDISPELREMAKSCKSIDELKELCKKMGASLSKEKLEAIAGGFPICPRDSCMTKCPFVLG